MRGPRIWFFIASVSEYAWSSSPGIRNTAMRYSFLLSLIAILVAAAASAQAQTATARARDLGIPFDGKTGQFNAITDVPGVEVGYATLVRGEGPLVVGQGPVRTGVTAIFPLGKTAREGVTAGWFSFNGEGEMIGTVRLSEFGELYGPVVLTNTLSVGAVQAAVLAWTRQRFGEGLLKQVFPDLLYRKSFPIVSETWDGFLNDIFGQHVTEADVFAALDGAARGPLAEGNVGGGTGMRTFEFKGGTGTSSRRVATGQGTYTLGVLVQSNFGRRQQMRIAGVPVGAEIPDLMPEVRAAEPPDGNSIVIVIATDAPLLPIQLDRVARRATLALGRMGGIGMDGSGDLFVAFSTGNQLALHDIRPDFARPGGIAAGPASSTRTLQAVTDMNPLFEATVQATEEAIVNALVAGRTMTGINDNTIFALPHDRLRAILRRYNRLRE